ncbi:hypothetical protein XENTR_v10007482 [Xenopus tropicalis]|nr:hypothetical protein XENTR_v10007482 [Xenopus tropicalis]
MISIFPLGVEAMIKCHTGSQTHCSAPTTHCSTFHACYYPVTGTAGMAQCEAATTYTSFIVAQHWHHTVPASPKRLKGFPVEGIYDKHNKYWNIYEQMVETKYWANESL